jgi:tRNA 2-thiocytidine biosynthesis protein TtcA
VEKAGFEEFLSDWNIPYSIVDVPVLARLKPGRKMNCYWCSSQRRMELMKFAQNNGYNKIALGHHMDDILETFLMNMSYKGELSTMLPVLQYDNYPQTVIRPLALVKEQEIIQFAHMSRISQVTCTCNFDTQSKRKEMRSVLEFMTGGDNSIKNNIYKAMSNPVSRYMPNHEEN